MKDGDGNAKIQYPQHCSMDPFVMIGTKEHMEHLKVLFEVLRINELFVKKRKCKFVVI